MKRRLAILVMLAAALALLAGCATPTRTVVCATLAGVSVSRETGWQLAWGERHDALSGVGANSEIGKRTIGVVGGSVAGGVIGAVSGQPAMGALVGTVAGGIAAALDEDRPTSGTQTR